jgi:hypothetical protein
VPVDVAMPGLMPAYPDLAAVPLSLGVLFLDDARETLPHRAVQVA